MRNLARALVLGSLLLPTLAPVALAQQWHGGGGHGNWHGDIHRFALHDVGIWRGGRWFHGPHLGRIGWWWIAGGAYYFYPAPVYPYPDPYVPPIAVAASGPGQYWYYCPASGGYYPYVPQCSVPWQPVSAQ